jgi:hypothetical protein
MSEEVKDGDNGEGTKEFDASAFGSSGIVDTVDNNTDESNSNESTGDSSDNIETQDSEDTSFDWADNYSDDENSNTDENEDTNSDSNNDDNHNAGADNNNEVDDSHKGDGSTDNNNESADTNEGVNPPAVFDGSLTDEHFSAFADELGLKAKSLPELKQAMLDLEAENKRLQEIGGSNVTNKKIDSLQTYLKLDDKELIQKDLEARGFKGEQLEKAIDTLQDNGMLEIEATKVRNAINGSIENEKSAITQSARDEDAKQLRDREESVKALQTYLGDQTEMFGFKMAKDEETLGKVRDSHHKYITSGSYLKEITKDNESLAESAWLWKNRETLLKAARNNGLQQGRSEILNDLHNPDTDGGGTFVSPDGKGEFNVGKFRGSDNKKK